MIRTVVCVVGPHRVGQDEAGGGPGPPAGWGGGLRRLHADLPPDGHRHRQAHGGGGAGGIPHHMIDVAEPEENWSAAGMWRRPPSAWRISSAGESGPSSWAAPGCTWIPWSPLLRGPVYQAGASGSRPGGRGGIEPLREELRQVDPAAYDRIAAADEKRIIRALEVWHETGKTITQHNLETQQRPPGTGR